MYKYLQFRLCLLRVFPEYVVEYYWQTFGSTEVFWKGSPYCWPFCENYKLMLTSRFFVCLTYIVLSPILKHVYHQYFPCASRKVHAISDGDSIACITQSLLPDVRAIISTVVGNVNTFRLIGLQANCFVLGR